MGLRQLRARGERLLGARDEVPVEMGRIGIRDHDVGVQDGPIGEFDPAGDALLDADPLDGRAQADLHALSLHQASERLSHGAGAAHGEVHAVGAL